MLTRRAALLTLGGTMLSLSLGSISLVGSSPVLAAVSPPSNLTVAPATSVTLTWQDNSTNESGFKIDRRIGTGPYVELVRLTTPSQRSFTDGSVQAGQTYTYRVRSYIADVENSAYSNEATITAGGAPTPTPAAPTATPIVATTTSTAMPTPTPPPSPSGVAMPLVAPPGWERKFSEDFLENLPLGRWSGCASDGSGCSGLAGTSYYNRWWAYPTGWLDTSKHGTYDPARVLSVHDGMLDLWLRTVDGKPRVATLLPKHSPHTNLRVTYRYRVPLAIPGYKQAWLLWPDSNVWPRDGEIDCPEAHFNSASKIYCFVHRQDGKADSSDQYGVVTSVPAVGSWHTVTTEWITGQSVKFFIDGALVGQTTSRVPSAPMHIVIQTETTTVSPNVPDPATQGHLLVDWITIDTLAGN